MRLEEKRQLLLAARPLPAVEIVKHDSSMSLAHHMRNSSQYEKNPQIFVNKDKQKQYEILTE